MCHINTTDFHTQIHNLNQFVVRMRFFSPRRNIKPDLKLYCKLKVLIISTDIMEQQLNSLDIV